MYRYLIMVLMVMFNNIANAIENIVPNENFMLVLRELEGSNKQDFGFIQIGPSKGTLSNGEEITINSAWFKLIGDMHVRFVIDGKESMQNLTMEQFLAYGLTPEHAAEIAISNIKKRYGAPRSVPWTHGIIAVVGDSPDLGSSYFLDMEYWKNLLLKHPEGLIVGVPKRGGLIYAPLSDTEAVSLIEKGIQSLYETSGSLRVSSAIYLFKDDKWSIYRSPASLH